MIFIFFCQISQLRRNLWCLHRKPRKGNYQKDAFGSIQQSISKKLTKSSLSKRQLGRQGNKKERKKRERRTRSSFCALPRFWKSKLVNLLLFWTNWLLLNIYTIFSTCIAKVVDQITCFKNYKNRYNVEGEKANMSNENALFPSTTADLSPMTFSWGSNTHFQFPTCHGIRSLLYQLSAIVTSIGAKVLLGT